MTCLTCPTNIITNTKAASLNQFQTNPKLAKRLFDITKPYANSNTWFVEPSAGHGSFYNLLPKDRRIGVDIDETLKRDHPDYIICDYLECNKHMLKIDGIGRENIMVIGNPPFSDRTNGVIRNKHGSTVGGTSNLALKFLNHSATFADTICLLVGCNFRKLTLKDQINTELHLMYEEIIDNNNKFKLQSKEIRGVRTVFQIWQRKYDDDGTTLLRGLYFENVPLVNEGIWKYKSGKVGEFEFLDIGSARTNIVIKRWASSSRVGDVSTDRSMIKKLNNGVKKKRLRASTHFFLFAKNPTEVAKILTAKKQHIIDFCKDTSVAPSPTISRRDLVKIFIENEEKVEPEPEKTRQRSILSYMTHVYAM